LKARVHVFLVYLFTLYSLAEHYDKLVTWTRTQLSWWGFHVAAPTVWNSLPTHLPLVVYSSTEMQRRPITSLRPVHESLRTS